MRPIARRRFLALLPATGVGLLGAGCSRAADRTGPPRIISTTTAGRTVDLLVRSPSIDGAVAVRLLLPRAYEAEPDRRWPALYLLHGARDTYLSWTRSTDIEALSAPDDVIVVMPDAGVVGFYSDWRRGPQWEHFHLVELWAQLRQHYGVNGDRAIAGLSMGGLGAMAYAARHPGMFTAAASFSGVLDTRLSKEVSATYASLVDGNGVDMDQLWGDPEEDADRWAAHNPRDLAARLPAIPLYISCGDGDPGPLDGPTTQRDDLEAGVYQQNVAFRTRLQQLSIPATYDFYGAGTHSWPYWQRSLHAAWPMLMQALGVPGR